MTADKKYEIIVGLEIHVQLQTASKLFCGCSTEFGSAPNTQSCHVCTGMPGALPVLNKNALRLAIKTGLALNCNIQHHTKWDRKNYFYPDLPKGYQISQFDRPICFDGYLDIVDSKGRATGNRVRIERAHLEEDAGKSTHDESGKGGNTKIDLNRAGTPLLEIVTKPDLRSAEQTKDFLTELKLILTYIEVSDCNMQQGNLRVDANVNLLIDSQGNIATPIVEVKNLNSFRAVERAIKFEADRQFKIYQANSKTINDAPKQTRGWDDDRQETVLQREKEDSADYRYFPDPDLVSIETTQPEIDALSSEIGQLPFQVRAELVGQHQLTDYDADVLVKQGRGVVDFFRAGVQATGNPKLVSNWIQQEILRYLNESNQSIEDYPVRVDYFFALLNDVANQQLDQNRAKDVLGLMVAENLSVDDAKNKLGIVLVDSNAIDELCRRLIDENPAAVADIRSGNSKAIGSLIGKARKVNPNANPNDVRRTLMALLDDSSG